MTRKEEIEQASNLVFKIRLCPRTSFIRGAEWADQHPREGLWDSEKVIKFIRENVREYHKSGVFHVDDFINDLRKSMEE